MFAFEKAPKRSWPKVLGILAAVAVLLVIVVFVVIAAWPKPDPTVAVLATRDAFVNHDEQAFEQNVDVDAVLGDAIEQTLAYGASRATEGSSQGDKVVAQIGGAVLAQVLKNQEMNELHSDVQQLVSGVALDPQTSNQDETSVYLVPVMHVLLQAGVAYQGSTVLSQSGSTAEVAVNLQPAVGGPIELDLGLRFDNGRWRIVSLYHLDRLLAQYQSLFN